MEVKERDEKKRSIWWKVVTLGATLVILFVVGFFVIDFFTGNPLEGDWVSEEKGYYLEIDDDNEMTVKGTFDGEYIEYELEYKLDKKAKNITIKGSENLFEVSDEEDGVWTDAERDILTGTNAVTFEYNLGRKTLTLTEREYGQEFVFTKK